MSEREEFEAWASSECVCDLRRNEFGDYRSQGVRQWWDGWQARAARTASAEQAEPVAEMKGSYLYPLKSIPSGTKLYIAPDALQAEVERLTECLSRANDGFEEFERKYYLAIEERDALKAALSSIADYVADNWPMKNYNLQEIEDRLRAIDAARTAKPEVDHE